MYYVIFFHKLQGYFTFYVTLANMYLVPAKYQGLYILFLISHFSSEGERALKKSLSLPFSLSDDRSLALKENLWMLVALVVNFSF